MHFFLFQEKKTWIELLKYSSWQCDSAFSITIMIRNKLGWTNSFSHCRFQKNLYPDLQRRAFSNGCHYFVINWAACLPLIQHWLYAFKVIQLSRWKNLPFRANLAVTHTSLHLAHRNLYRWISGEHPVRHEIIVSLLLQYHLSCTGKERV